MFRELWEEVGLKAEHVKIVGRTREWLRYDVPEQWIRRELRGNYRGQKQIWFLLRLTGRDCDVCLRATTHPEFDAWRWHEYWVPLETVIEFKRDVYQQALLELSRFVFKPGRPHHKAPRPRAPQTVDVRAASGAIAAATRAARTKRPDGYVTYQVVAVDQFGLFDEPEHGLDFTGWPARDLPCLGARVVDEAASNLAPLRIEARDDVAPLELAVDFHDPDRQEAPAARTGQPWQRRHRRRLGPSAAGDRRATACARSALPSRRSAECRSSRRRRVAAGRRAPARRQ